MSIAMGEITSESTPHSFSVSPSASSGVTFDSIDAANFTTCAESISLIRRSVASSSLQPGIMIVKRKHEINNRFFGSLRAVILFFIYSMGCSVRSGKAFLIFKIMV